jgi:hypothetical protein
VAIVALQGLLGLASGTIGKCPKFQFGSKSTEAQRRPVKIHEIYRISRTIRFTVFSRSLDAWSLLKLDNPLTKKHKTDAESDAASLLFGPTCRRCFLPWLPAVSRYVFNIRVQIVQSPKKDYITKLI